MPLFRRYRHFWCLFAASLLIIPSIFHLVTKPEEKSLAEGRMLAPLPLMPSKLSELIELPKKLDAFLMDHYGLRNQILLTNALIHYFLRSPTNPSVFYGKDDWLFFTGDRTLQQVTRSQPKAQMINQFVDLLAAINALLQRQGRIFIVAIPPNKESIYSDKLPLWLQNKSGPTEYEVLLSELEKRKIKTVNLNSVLSEAVIYRSEPIYYRHDTHWNFIGAILAYNALITAAGKQDWKIRLENTLAQIKKIHFGDLARNLGLFGYLYEESPYVYLPKIKITSFKDGNSKKSFDGSFLIKYRDTGSTVLIIGDSFSKFYFKPLFAKNTSRLIWTHHKKCAFDWSFITRYQPDIVFYMPVERHIGCNFNARPNGIDEQLFANSSASVLKISGFKDVNKIKAIAQLDIADQAGKNNAIVLNSTGNDPRIWLPLFNTSLAKSFIVKIEIESPIETRLEIYYMTDLQRKFSSTRKVSQKIVKGINKIYLYLTPTGEEIYGKLRLDVGSAPGTYLLENIEIRANTLF